MDGFFLRIFNGTGKGTGKWTVWPKGVDELVTLRKNSGSQILEQKFRESSAEKSLTRCALFWRPLREAPSGGPLYFDALYALQKEKKIFSACLLGTAGLVLAHLKTPKQLLNFFLICW